nr:hypothetical protein HK105_006898 [Polyrhizophydium stewartii]
MANNAGRAIKRALTGEPKAKPTRVAFSPIIVNLMTNLALTKSLSVGASGAGPDLILEQPILYLGSALHGLNPLVLVQLGITHIVNVSGAANAFEDGVPAAVAKYKLEETVNDSQRKTLQQWMEIDPNVRWKYWSANIADTSSEDMSVHFKPCFKFIDDAFKEPNARVLVHCQAGVSRSATLVMGYLMHSCKWPLDRTWKHVVERRKIVVPNLGFANQLVEYHNKLFPNEPLGAQDFRSLYGF